MKYRTKIKSSLLLVVSSNFLGFEIWQIFCQLIECCLISWIKPFDKLRVGRAKQEEWKEGRGTLRQAQGRLRSIHSRRCEEYSIDISEPQASYKVTTGPANYFTTIPLPVPLLRSRRPCRDRWQTTQHHLPAHRRPGLRRSLLPRQSHSQNAEPRPPQR